MKFLSDVLIKAGLLAEGSVQFPNLPNATVDADKFVISDSGVIKYRTGAELLSDIGAVTSSRIITINNVSYDLSANRTWSIDLDSVTDVNSVTTNKMTVGGVGLTGMTAGSGALYYNAASNRVTVANYNAGGSVYMEVNGGSYSAIFHPDLMFESLGAIKGVYAAATTDTDKFLVSDAGVVKYRTGSQILSDIGGQNAISLTTNGYSGASTFSSNVLNIPNYGAVDDGVISGGIVTWTGTGLVFTVSVCNYYINGVNYTSPLTSITLDAADPTFDRIDVFAVNTSGQVVVIKGTPSSNPVEPEGDTTTTIGLTNVTVTAGSTTPNQAVRNLIYDENVETWTQTIAGGIGFSYNNVDTTQFYTPTKSFKVIQGLQYAQLRFSKAVAMDIRDYKSLSFAIRLDTAWTNQTFQISFYNGTTRTALYTIGNTNVVGFNRSLANQWQFVTLNLALFSFNSNAFTGVQIFTSGSNRTYWVDTVSLNGGINNPTGTTSNSFGFVNGSTGSAAATISADTLSIVGTGLATTSATGKTLTIAVPTPIPSQTGNTGKYLTTNGSIVSWASVDALPTQTGNTGKYLTTNGSVASWATVDALPLQSGNIGKFLTTDGSTASWVSISTTNIYNADGTLTGPRTLTYTGNNLTFFTVRPSVGNRYITFHNSGRVTFNGQTENTSYEVNVNGSLLAGAGSMIGGTSGVQFDSGNLRLIFQGWNSVSFLRAGGVSVLYSDGTTASLGSGAPRLNISATQFSTNGSGVGSGANVYSIGGGTNNITSGNYIASIGVENLWGVTTASTNIAIGGRWAGSGALRGNTGNHSSSIFLGVGTGAITNSTILTNTTIIGHDITTDASNTVILGRSDQNVTIGGVLNAGYKLDVNGTARIQGNTSIVGTLTTRTANSYNFTETSSNTGEAIVTAQTNGQATFIGFRARGTSFGGNFQGKVFIQAPQGTYLTSNNAGTPSFSDVSQTWHQSKAVSFNTSIEYASAIVAIDSTTKGFLPPRINLTQRLAISSPEIGLVVYQTDTTEGLYQYTSTGWQPLASGGGVAGASALFNFYNFV